HGWGLAFRRQALAHGAIRTARLVRRKIELLASLSGNQRLAVGNQHRERRLRRRRVAQPPDGRRHRANGAGKLGSVARSRERTLREQLREQDEEEHLAVGLAQDETAQRRLHALDERGAMDVEVRNIAVVGEHPAPILKWVTVEDRLLA